MRLSRILLTLVLVSVPLGACLREEEPPQYPPQQAGPPPGPQPTYAPPTAYPPGSTPEPAPPGPPSPTSPPPAATAGPVPALGFPCAGDNDLQCPFARCVQGRCGGCRDANDCKPGASCVGTPLGQSCMPGGGTATPAPTATTPPPAPTATTPPPAGDPYAAARARCVQQINSYRGTKSVAAVSQNSAQQACADQAASSDAQSSQPHGAFGTCGETAQNECPGWKGNVDVVLDSCLKMMFDEGPGQGSAHGHYNNMMDAGYRSVSCGFHTTADGSVWIVHNFYR